MKNTLADLNNHLFEQLERLNDEDLTDEELEREIKRTDSMVDISKVIVDNANTILQAHKLNAEWNIQKTESTKILIGNDMKKEE